MKRHLPLALLLCGACGWAMRAQAQPADAPVPATIPRVELAPVAPMGKVAPVGAVPIVPAQVAPITGVEVAGASDATIVKFNAQSLSMPPLLARLRARELTPQKAYDKGELDADGAIYILESLVDAWGGFYWNKNEDLRRDIVAILVAHGQDRIENAAQLSPAVRLWLADYYVSTKDAKSLALSESILAPLPHPLPASAYDGPEFPLAFQALERIAWYYRYTGQFEKSAEAWLRLSDYCAPTGWWAPNALLEAARAYNAAGMPAKADEFYAQIAKYGDAWHTNMVSLDKAEHLMDNYEWAQAERVLRDSLSVQQAMEVPSVPAQIAVLSRLVALRYIAGDFSSARELAAQTRALYQTVPDARVNGGITSDLDLGDDYVRYMDKWEQTPLSLSGETYLILHPVDTPQQASEWSQKSWKENGVLVGPRWVTTKAWVRGTPFQAQVRIDSFRPVPMTVTSSNPLLTTQLSDTGRPEEAAMQVSKNLTVEIAPQALVPGQTIEATLTVKSPKFPNYVLPLQFHIEIQ